MPPSEIRKEAREALVGKWGKALCIMLVFFAFVLLYETIGEVLKISMPLLYRVFDILYLVVSIPLGFGLVISFMKLKRSESVSAVSFFKEGFDHFGKAWGIYWYTFLKMLLPCLCMFSVIILIIILAVFNMRANVDSLATTLLTSVSVVLYVLTLVYVASRGFLYVLAFPIAYDNPELPAKECVKKSETLMKGNRGNYFMLGLSFIGWSILAVLTLGIGLLWLIPYMQVAIVCFYERIIVNKQKKIDGNAKLIEEK